MLRRAFLFMFFAACFFILHGQVVVNEIMYDSSGPDKEWVELFNLMDSDVVLDSTYIITDRTTREYTFEGATVPASGFLTIFLFPGGLGDTFELYFEPDVDASAANVQLNNSGGDDVILMKIDGSDTTIIDSVAYSPDWGSGSNGYGKTLSRIDPEGNSNYAGNWGESEDSLGTPGEVNVVAVIPQKKSVPHTLKISATPNPFNAACELKIDSETPCNANIIDVSGKITSSWALPTGASSIIWNADNSPSGLYILSIKNGSEHINHPIILMR